MKAVFLTGLRQMEMREAPAPRLSAPHDVLLRVDTLGVCGSDIHYYTQGRIGSAVVKFPQLLGHELAGTVQAVGPQVKTLKPGQRVAIDPLIACNECDQCRAGRPHTCRHQQFLGNPGQLPGALAEFLVMPDACCSPVPDALSDDDAAVVEPLSVGLYAAHLAQLPPTARVAILGSGPIGLCTLLSLHAHAPLPVYMTDLLDARLAVARTCGAAWTGNPRNENIVASIRAAEPLGVDAVFECAGEQETLDQGLELLKPGGTLLIVGIPEVDRVSFDINLLRRNELRIVNVRRQNHCVEPAIELITSGRINVRPLVTHHFSFAETRQAFELVSNKQDGVVKAIIRVSSGK